jgi:hypothetical protein
MKVNSIYTNRISVLTKKFKEDVGKSDIFSYYDKEYFLKNKETRKQFLMENETDEELVKRFNNFHIKYQQYTQDCADALKCCYPIEVLYKEPVTDVFKGNHQSISPSEAKASDSPYYRTYLSLTMKHYQDLLEKYGHYEFDGFSEKDLNTMSGERLLEGETREDYLNKYRSFTKEVEDYDKEQFEIMMKEHSKF